MHNFAICRTYCLRKNRSLRGQKGEFMKQNSKRGRGVLLAALGMAALMMLALVCLYRIWERPPELGEAKLTVHQTPSETARPAPVVEEYTAADALPEGEAVATARQDGVYTILLVGNDDGNGNTDTLILGKIDTRQHRMDFVSIPRDTLINTSWEVRKINAVYWGSRNNGGDGISALKQQVARLTGFEPDCYAVVDLDVFVEAVDLIGGVYFDVPMAMDYEDLSQDLRIHLQPGYQLLDGYQAMGLCRYRSGYVMGDLGRIEMQQQFLRACASQLLALGNIPKAPELVRLLAESLDTDLSAANIAFLLRQFLACKAEDIHFVTAPTTPETVSGYSYAVLELDKWLELVNDRLNPFETPITWQNVDLVYRSGAGFAGTAGLRDPDYYRAGEETEPVAAELPPETGDSGGVPTVIVVGP